MPKRNPVEARKNDTAKRVAVLDHLVDTCGYPEAEARKVVGKDKPGRREARVALSPTQLDTYERAVKRDIRAIDLRTAMLLTAYAGLRVGEVTKLRWADILTRSGGAARIHVVSHKGPKGFDQTVRPRDVPVTKRIAQLLDEYIARVEKRAAAGKQPLQWVFPARTGNHMSPARVRSGIKRIVSAEPSLRGLTPHVLRHTFATEVLRRCGSLTELQAALGHKSKTTTLVYLHPDDYTPTRSNGRHRRRRR